MRVKTYPCPYCEAPVVFEKFGITANGVLMMGVCTGEKPHKVSRRPEVVIGCILEPAIVGFNVEMPEEEPKKNGRK